MNGPQAITRRGEWQAKCADAWGRPRGTIACNILKHIHMYKAVGFRTSILLPACYHTSSMDGVYGFLKLILPPPEYLAKDGTSYPTEAAAHLHDELPALCDPEMVAAALEEFGLTYRELSRRIGCSEQWLRRLVRCKKR